MRDDYNFTCPECHESLDYDPKGTPCEKCEWWLEEHHREEQQKYERMMWEREQEELEYWRDERNRR